MTDTVVASSLRCDDNTTSKITNSLNKFFNAASGGLGGAFDMVAGLDTAVSEISDAMSGLTNSMSNLLQNKLSEIGSFEVCEDSSYFVLFNDGMINHEEY